MRTERAVVAAIVCLAASGCRTQPATVPGPSAAAPSVSIRATMAGLTMHRQVGAEFTARQDAYVLVGHVAGDGRVRVLFPANANRSGLIRAGTQYVIPSFPADLDANPSLYSLTQPPQRNAGARMDSYDGHGSAFLFVISSAAPLAYDEIADDDGEFDSYLLPNYWYEMDPRSEIDQFARDVAGKSKYRIEYAYSFNTNRYASYSDRMMDCAQYSFNAGTVGSPLYAGTLGYASLWNLFGSSIGFWDMNDPYAGMYPCARGGAPVVFALGTSPSAPQKEYARVRVLHKPLVSTQAADYRNGDDDPFPDLDRRPTMSRGSYTPSHAPASTSTRPRTSQPSPSHATRPAPSARPAPARQPPSHQQ